MISARERKMDDSKVPARVEAFGPIESTVRERWDSILRDWRRGYAADESLAQLETLIEVERREIFEAQGGEIDTERARDWGRAHVVHFTNIDHVRNSRRYFDDVRAYWMQWEERTSTALANLSLEALRAMIIVNGAAIIASLAVLSGQVSDPTDAAIRVAKVTVVCSVVSLMMMGLGHAIIWLRGSELAGRIRATLIGNVRHSRLIAIWRYTRRHGSGLINLANALIFGSIGVFGLSAIVSALILAFS